MENHEIKSGWVEKRSQYLKQWRPRWLVLTSRSLCTFKTDSNSTKPTMELLLESILDASPHFSDSSTDFIFIIILPSHRYLLRVPHDSEMCAWLNLINHTRQGLKLPSFGSPNYYHESKVLSDESLITSFTRIKELLYQREEELLHNLDSLYNTYLEKATQETKEITEICEQEIEKYNNVCKVLKAPTEIISKAREVQSASKNSVNYRDLEAFHVSKLVVSMQSENLDKLIRANIKVCLGNPSEVMVRRTHITRALKWRYTGERIDALSFAVSQDIKLTAVGVCTPHKPGRITYIKEFHVLKGGSTNSTSIYRHSQKVTMNNHPENSVFKLVLDTPVLIKRDNKYTVYFLNEGAHTYKCVDCVTSLEGPNRCTWAFYNSVFSQNHQSNRCDTVCGPIADFYFMVA